MITKATKKLQTILDGVVSDHKFQPIIDMDTGEVATTFCNLGLTAVAEEYGIKSFRGLLANEICDFLAKNWTKIDGRKANALANTGVLCIAGQKADRHGHVATVAPVGMVYSGKWKKDCPVLANIGRKNGFMGANFAFATEPSYWVR